MNKTNIKINCDGDCQNCKDAITSIHGDEEYISGCNKNKKGAAE